ncbi:MAG: outer membrane beta-barrel protein [Candidatus Aquirickettsiella sp.]
MLKKVLSTTLAISALGAMAAHAAAPGVYVTGQLGYANNNMEIQTETQTHNIIPINGVSKSNFAGRVAVGYQFNQNFAVEAGYFRTAQKRLTLAYFDQYSNQIETGGKLKYSQRAIDLVAKGILPVNSNLNLYGKLGVAYLTTHGSFNSASSASDDFSYNLENVAKRKWAPEAAIGVSYDITPNVAVDTSWTHIQPLGNNKPGNIDFIAVGLSYNFG